MQNIKFLKIEQQYIIREKKITNLLQLCKICVILISRSIYLIFWHLRFLKLIFDDCHNQGLIVQVGHYCKIDIEICVIR